MKILSISKYAMFLFAFGLLLTSCAKENTDETEEVAETNYEIEISLRGVTNTYDAYAAYCNENGIESFSVSNKLNLLDNDVWTTDIVEGDFVIHYRSDANGSFTLGGAIIESTLTDGTVIKNFTTAVESSEGENPLVDVNITTANSTEVIGSMSGDFLVILDPITQQFDQVPFAVRFAGEVDPSLTPIYCE